MYSCYEYMWLMKKYILLNLLVSLILIKGMAQIKNFSVSLLPIITADPYIGVGFGALGNATFLMGDSSNTRYSNMMLYGIYTTKGQLGFQFNHQVFTKEEKWMIQGKLQYLDWPENTYRLGGNVSGDTPYKEKISYKAIEFEERVMKRIGKKNFIGLQYRLFSCWDLKSDLNGNSSFFNNVAIGNKSFVASGIGVHFIHDSRDNVQNAYSGKYLEVALNPFLSILGSTQDWVNFRIDGRIYKNFSTNKQKVLATRFVFEQAGGSIPYMIMPQFGRYYSTRGFVQGRYRGNTFASLESEYRTHLWRFIGGVAFANINTISEPKGEFKYFNPAAGAGLRFCINKKQRTNIRIDYAKGTQDNGGIYFQVTEVF